MIKLCPRCRMPAAVLGQAFTAISDDGQRRGVVGICARCMADYCQLSPKARKGMSIALERALDDPGRYAAVLFDDIGAAELATALLGHPEWSAATLAAMGWGKTLPTSTTTIRGHRRENYAKW